MANEDDVAAARHTLEIVQAKAPDALPLDRYRPYLQAAIPFWRSVEKQAHAVGDLETALSATTERLAAEAAFREIAGRSFHTENDRLTEAEAIAL